MKAPIYFGLAVACLALNAFIVSAQMHVTQVGAMIYLVHNRNLIDGLQVALNLSAALLGVIGIFHLLSGALRNMNWRIVFLVAILLATITAAISLLRVRTWGAAADVVSPLPWKEYEQSAKVLGEYELALDSHPPNRSLRCLVQRRELP